MVLFDAALLPGVFPPVVLGVVLEVVELSVGCVG